MMAQFRKWHNFGVKMKSVIALRKALKVFNTVVTHLQAAADMADKEVDNANKLVVNLQNDIQQAKEVSTRAKNAIESLRNIIGSDQKQKIQE